MGRSSSCPTKNPNCPARAAMFRAPGHSGSTSSGAAECAHQRPKSAMLAHDLARGFGPASLGVRPMKKLVLETTSPFQGLPELVAYDEGLFKKEGLLVEWAERDEAGIKQAEALVDSPKGVDPFG